MTKSCLRMEWRVIFLPVLLILFSSAAYRAGAQAVSAPFNANYTVANLGAVPELPASYGGLTIKHGDTNTLVIAGLWRNELGAIYEIPVVRDGSGHITGFSGTATLVKSAPFIDGGLAYESSGVLFATTYPGNTILQFKSASVVPDKSIDLGPFSVQASTGPIAFPPSGFPGEGLFTVASYDGWSWYSVSYSPDGLGTFNVNFAFSPQPVSGSPEGTVYVPINSPNFTDYTTVLISENSVSRVSAYDINPGTGDPILATRRSFVTSLVGARGGAIDPVTKDFLFVTTGGGDHVVAIRGFGTIGLPTQTPTRTATATPTQTASPSPSPTVSPSPSPEATEPPTETPTESPSPTDVPTEVPTDSPSPSPSPSDSPSATPTETELTPTPTLDSTPQPSDTPSPSPTHTVTPAPTTIPPTATPNGRIRGDFDNTGCTDISDFLFLLDYWTLLSPIGPPLIDLNDFLALLDNWNSGDNC